MEGGRRCKAWCRGGRRWHVGRVSFSRLLIAPLTIPRPGFGPASDALWDCESPRCHELIMVVGTVRNALPPPNTVSRAADRPLPQPSTGASQSSTLTSVQTPTANGRALPSAPSGLGKESAYDTVRNASQPPPPAPPAPVEEPQVDEDMMLEGVIIPAITNVRLNWLVVADWIAGNAYS